MKACGGLNEEAFILVPPNPDDVLSHGYQLHIKAGIRQQQLSCIKQLTSAKKLSITREPEKRLIVIYRQAPFRCPVCNAIFNTEIEMLAHKSNAHEHIHRKGEESEETETGIH